MNRSLLRGLVVGILLMATFGSGCATPTAAPIEQPVAPVAPATVAPATVAPATVAAAVTEAPAEFVIGWSGAALLDDFQWQLLQGVQTKAAELGVKIIHIENNNDPVKQAADIEDLLAQHIDVLLIDCANADAIVPSIDKAVAMGIPVFTIDNASNSDKVLSHSGNDLYCIGYRSVEYLANLIGGEGKVLHINGIAGMSLVKWNTDGVNAYITEHPDIKLVMESYGDWDPAKAQAATEDTLQTNPDLKGIYVISEVMTQGPIQSLKAQGLSDKVKIVSGGYGAESQAWLARGDIAAAFEWSVKQGGADAMQRIYDYVVNGVEPNAFYAWPVTVHTPEGDAGQLDCPIGNWTP